MNTASLENSKKLYEVSGWEETDFYHNLDSVGNVVAPAHQSLSRIGKPLINRYPAYDLGYLMRKLPDGTRLVKSDNDYYVANNINGLTDVNSDGKTPEDALAELAIYLIEKELLDVATN